MADKNLVCKDCGKAFTFTAGEQEFYSEKQFPEPIRCPDCRKAKKDSKGSKPTNGKYTSNGR